MATIVAVRSGNWSDTTVWDLERTPADGELVQAGAYIIEFDEDVDQPNTVLDATTGSYQYSGAGTRSVTANANMGTHTGNGIVRNAATGTLHFPGEVVGGSGSSAYGAYNSGAGSMIIGTATGGSGSSAYGAYNSGAGSMTIDTANGGSGSFVYGAHNSGAGSMTIDTANGGSGWNAFGAYNSGAGSMIIGTATGGSGSSAYGAYIAYSGSMIIGTATGGSGVGAYGAYNASYGELHCDLAVGNDYGQAGLHDYSNPGVVGGNAGQTTVKRMQAGSHGQAATGGSVYIEVDATNSAQFATHPIRDPITMYPLGGNIGPVSIEIGGGGIRIS